MSMAKRARKQVDAAVVQQAMAALGITTPVRAWKEEGGRGGRLVLLLATGERVVWEVVERGLPGRRGGQDARAPLEGEAKKGGQDAGAPGEEVGDDDVR
jgi:hypothetical protein